MSSASQMIALFDGQSMLSELHITPSVGQTGELSEPQTTESLGQIAVLDPLQVLLLHLQKLMKHSGSIGLDSPPLIWFRSIGGNDCFSLKILNFKSDIMNVNKLFRKYRYKFCELTAEFNERVLIFVKLMIAYAS
ncbi:MAG: hypothetical protein NC127_06690 [Muribaculum sp.]|nr:hypothetical protein [Muribaculum sp.]